MRSDSWKNCNLSVVLVFSLVILLHATDHSRPVLEPYQLSGKRMVFVDWYFVSPGHFDWLDADGESVYTSKHSRIGPYDAHFVSFDTPRGIRLFVEPARREIPVIATDKAWDQWGIRLSTLIREKGRYRLWGTCNSDHLSQYNCYFESANGIQWLKPDLGLREFKGSRDNNLLDTQVQLSVFIDPSSPQDERYKTMWHDRISAEDFEKYKNSRPWSWYALELDAPLVHVLWGAVSADGLRWNTLPDPLAFEHADTQNICYFDSLSGKYVLYTRSHLVGPRAPGQPYPEQKFHQRISRRAVARMESEDFRQFPLSEIILETDSDMHPSEQFYTNCYTTIPGAPGQHLMFPTIYSVADDGAKIVLYSSHNGRNWHRVPGPPVTVISDYGNPDGGWLSAHPNLVERPDGDWILPYNGYDVPHKYPRGAYRFEPGMLVWPKGRLAGIEAPEEGFFATVYFLLPGTKIKINALTRRAGHIKVELVDMDLMPIKGFTFEESDAVIGNHYLTTLTWQKRSDLSELADTPVMMRFQMKMAKVFGLEFE